MNAQRCSLCFAFSSSTLRHFTLNPSPSLSCHPSQRHKHTLQWKCVCRAAERLSDLLSQPRVFACLWTSFSDTYSARGAWGVCSLCLGVCESWWGSDSCLMCVKLSDHMHTSTPALPHFTKATVSAKVLFVFWRTLSQTRVEKLWCCRW